METQPNWIQAIERWILWTILTGISWPFGFILSKGFIFFAFPKITDAGEQFVSLVIGGITIAVA